MIIIINFEVIYDSFSVLSLVFYLNKQFYHFNNFSYIFFIYICSFSFIWRDIFHCTIFIIDRLWGDHGQATLEAAHVCLINATGLGTEILKSLVLPGIGAFTIVDGKKITIEDVEPKYVYIINIVTVRSIVYSRDLFQCDTLNGLELVFF